MGIILVQVWGCYHNPGEFRDLTKATDAELQGARLVGLS